MANFSTQLGLRRRITLALAAAAAATAAFLLVGTLWIVNGLIDRADRRELQGRYDMMIALLQEEARRALSMSAVVAAMPPVQEAVARDDRATLAGFFSTGFAGLKAAYDAEQFQFHLPPATAFFRVHMPGKYGDDLSGFRRTVVEANRTGSPVSGLEDGVAGLGIRGVMPVTRNGHHLGTVEFGLSFGRSFFERFKQLYGIDVALHLVGQDGFRTYASTLGDRSLFGADDYRAAAAGAMPVRKDTLGGVPVAAMLGPVKDFSGRPLGAVELVMDNSDYAATLAWTHKVMFGTAALGVVLASLAGWWLARGIAQPIQRITGVMRELASGNLDVSLPPRRGADEVGQMLSAVEVFRRNAIDRLRLEAESRAEHEAAAAEKHAALLRMAETVEADTAATLVQIRTRTGAIMATADELSASAIHTRGSAETAAGAASRVLAIAETVASAAEQLAVSIREISSQVAQSSAVAGRAVTAGTETRHKIEMLNREVERIGVVADMIGAIASRTNLLALNATIEAARAGEAGKGFAVVAAEVKQLATQTAVATGEIGQHIAQVRAAMQAAVVAVTQIGDTVGEVDSIAAGIAASVEQQSAATAEIARHVSETAGAANQMTMRTAEVSEEAGETGQRAVRVRDGAADLNAAMEGLRESVIRAVRSAVPQQAIAGRDAA